MTDGRISPELWALLCSGLLIPTDIFCRGTELPVARASRVLLLRQMPSLTDHVRPDDDLNLMGVSMSYSYQEVPARVSREPNRAPEKRIPLGEKSLSLLHGDLLSYPDLLCSCRDDERETVPCPTADSRPTYHSFFFAAN